MASPPPPGYGITNNIDPNNPRNGGPGSTFIGPLDAQPVAAAPAAPGTFAPPNGQTLASAPLAAPIANPTVSAPAATPFLQPSANIQGANLSQPGAAESFYGQQQNQFTNPNALQQYWSSVGSNFNNPGKNNSQGIFNQFQSSQPQDMSSYFNNAVQNTNADISGAMAAQGLTGSSAALGQMSAADQNLRAQQAMANAQYGLQRGQLGGQLAGQADQTTLANLMGGGSIAGNVAGQNLSNLLGGASTANAAQEAQMAREGQGYNQLMGYAGATTGVGNQIGQAGISAADQLLNDYLTSSVAGPSATYGIQASTGGVPGGAGDIIGGGINQFGGMMLGGVGPFAPDVPKKSAA